MQRRKFAELLVEGKISPETFEEWNRETGRKRLPDAVKVNEEAIVMRWLFLAWPYFLAQATVVGIIRFVIVR